MSLRLISAWVLCGALVLALAALVFRYPSWAAGGASVFAAAGAAAAWLLAGGSARRGSSHSSGAGVATAQASPSEKLTLSAKSAARAAEANAANVPANELLEAMMNSMREGMLVVDADLRVVASNAAARSLFGFGESAAAQQQQPRLGDLTRNPSVLSAYLGAIERGERVEVKVEMADG
ncbi:MAG TPA: PAS domain-containing protein, partial [Pyrinomonadaceae bacterium]|nr:PAS domain-containing protein [Pyrinomonadaceae bacterium]